MRIISVESLESAQQPAQVLGCICRDVAIKRKIGAGHIVEGASATSQSNSGLRALQRKMALRLTSSNRKAKAVVMGDGMISRPPQVDRVPPF